MGSAAVLSGTSSDRERGEGRTLPGIKYFVPLPPTPATWSWQCAPAFCPSAFHLLPFYPTRRSCRHVLVLPNSLAFWHPLKQLLAAQAVQVLLDAMAPPIIKSGVVPAVFCRLLSPQYTLTTTLLSLRRATISQPCPSRCSPIVALDKPKQPWTFWSGLPTKKHNAGSQTSRSRSRLRSTPTFASILRTSTSSSRDTQMKPRSISRSYAGNGNGSLRESQACFLVDWPL